MQTTSLKRYAFFQETKGRIPMKYMLIRVCAMMLAVCLCLSTGGCTNQEAPSSGTISSSQSSSSNSGSQPDLVGLRRHRFRRRNRAYPRQRSPLRTKPRGTSSGKSSHRTSPDFPVRTSSTQKLWRSNRMPWQTCRKPQRETAARDRRPHCSTRVYSTTRTAGCYRSG